jgi:hypothetical protein
VIDGTPIINDGLEGGLNLPVLDKVLNKLWKGASFV